MGGWQLFGAPCFSEASLISVCRVAFVILRQSMIEGRYRQEFDLTKFNLVLGYLYDDIGFVSLFCFILVGGGRQSPQDGTNERAKPMLS